MSTEAYPATPSARPTQDAPVMIKLPEAVGQGDSAMIFRAHLAMIDSALVDALDRMVIKAPEVANQVLAAGALGEISRGRAVRALVEYQATKVAVAPLGL